MTQTHTPLPWAKEMFVDNRKHGGDHHTYRITPQRGVYGTLFEYDADYALLACNSYYDNQALIASQAAEIARLREANEWKPISTCPMQEPVDLWCVYGGEEFARFDGGASIGRLVSSRFKHPEYGFLGNQSNDGVPRRDGPDLVPVAWRKAVPDCPAELIAEVMGIPLTLEDAAALEARS